MAKGDATAVKTNLNNLQNQSNSGWQDMRNTWSGPFNQDTSDFNNSFGSSSAGFNSIMNQNFSPTSSMINDLWYGSGVSGGIDESDISNMGADTMGGFQNFAQNGGLTPQFQQSFGDLSNSFNTYGSDINQGISDFQSIFSQPVDPATQQTMLANGSFQNFIDTGGFSASDIQNMRSRANSPILSLYSNAADNLAQSAAVSGGYGPNTGAAQAQMARDLTQATSQQDINTEAQIAQQVQQGKEFGAAGMSQAGTALGQMQLQGREAGATGVAQTGLAAQQNIIGEQQAQTQVQQLDDQMKLAGLSGMTDIEKTRLQGELQNASINEQASAVNAELQAQKAEMQFQSEWQSPIISAGLTAQGAQGQEGLANIAGNQSDVFANLFQNSFTNQMNNNLGLAGLGIQAAQLPSSYQSALGNIGGTIGLISDLTGAFTGGLVGGGGPGSSSSASGRAPSMFSQPYAGTDTVGYPGDGISSINPMIASSLYGNGNQISDPFSNNTFAQTQTPNLYGNQYNPFSLYSM